MDAILCLQNELLHFSEKYQRDAVKLHRHIMREELFSKIVSMRSSSQSSANYLRETRQWVIHSFGETLLACYLLSLRHKDE